MNVYELDTLTLNYIRLPVDNDNRNEFSEFFLTAYNEIYRRVMAEKVKLITKELIELEKGCFSEEKLSKKCIALREVRSVNGEKLGWQREEETNIYVYTNDKSVWVSYCYMPPLLCNPVPTCPPLESCPENTPKIPVEYHNLFSLWAAYRWFQSRRKFADAAYYYESASEVIQLLGSQQSSFETFHFHYLD
jgi:hypothetical protein